MFPDLEATLQVDCWAWYFSKFGRLLEQSISNDKVRGNTCDCNWERRIQAMEECVYISGHQVRRQMYWSWRTGREI